MRYYRRVNVSDRFTEWYQKCKNMLSDEIHHSFEKFLKENFTDVEFDVFCNREFDRISFCDLGNEKVYYTNVKTYSVDFYKTQFKTNSHGELSIEYLDEKGQKAVLLLDKLEQLNSQFHCGYASRRNAILKAIFLAEDNENDEFLKLYEEITG